MKSGQRRKKTVQNKADVGNTHESIRTILSNASLSLTNVVKSKDTFEVIEAFLKDTLENVALKATARFIKATKEIFKNNKQ